MIKLHKRDSCRGCFGKDLHVFLDLGDVPLAGGYLSEDQLDKNQKFPLKVSYCNSCGLVQIQDFIDPSVLFGKYLYSSSVIKSLSEHFYEYANFLKNNFLNKQHAKLVEFGCNDGVLLQYFKDEKNIEAYGVDPSPNISKLASDKGFHIYNDYFNSVTSRKIFNDIGEVDVVTGSNVFAHVDDIHEIIRASKSLLKCNGIFVVEVHYLGTLLDQFQYDTIYHEHLCYYSVTALRNIFALHNLKIVDVKALSMHGGSIRVISTQMESWREINLSVDEFIRREENITLELLNNFQVKVDSHREELSKLLKRCKSSGKRLVGYGASGRGTMLLNHCGIDKSILDYVVDISPLRIGLYIPNVNLSIMSPLVARENKPDMFLLLAWNYLGINKGTRERTNPKGEQSL